MNCFFTTRKFLKHSLYCETIRNLSTKHSKHYKLCYNTPTFKVNNVILRCSGFTKSDPLFSNRKRRNPIFNHALRNLSTTTTRAAPFLPANDQEVISNDALGTVDPEFIQQISQSFLVKCAQNYIVEFHSLTGLPWWASIACCAIIMRTLTLPLAFSQVRILAKLENVYHEMEDSIKSLKREANITVRHFGWTEDFARDQYNAAVKKEYERLIIRDNCHPAKCIILVLMQLPIWVSFTIATRNLCTMMPIPDTAAQITALELAVDGIGWFHNLTIPDPYYILPITLTLLNLSIMEVHKLFKVHNPKISKVIINNLMRCLTVAIGLVSTQLPTAVNIYWVTSSTYGLIQAFLVQSPRLKRLFRIPIAESELEHPYRHFLKQTISKIQK